MEFLNFLISIITKYYRLLLTGIGVTLLLAISGTVVGFIIGLLVGVVRTIPVPRKKGVLYVLVGILRVILNIYVQIFRCTPMMVQAMVIFYGISRLTGFEINHLFAGFVIVSINTGAYMSEIVRGGIDSIDRGQFDACHAVGMTHWQTMLHVIIPQTVRNILPATCNEFVINIKDTSVLNVIMVTELFYMGSAIVSINYRAFETYIVIAIIYFVLTYAVTRILRWVEAKMDGPKNYDVLNSGTSAEAVISAVKDTRRAIK